MQATPSPKPRQRRAMWVGGPPGRTMESIKRKLALDNIVVIKQAEKGEIPVDAEMVIVNKEMIDHNAFTDYKAKAKVRGIPFVVAHMNYTATRAALEHQGLVAPPPPALSLVGDLNNEDDQQWKDHDPMPETTPTTEHDLRAFLMSLPPSLRKVALECSAELKRNDEVAQVHDCLTTFLVGIVSIDSGSITEALNTYADQSALGRFRTLLAVADGEPR